MGNESSSTTHRGRSRDAIHRGVRDRDKAAGGAVAKLRHDKRPSNTVIDSGDTRRALRFRPRQTLWIRKVIEWFGLESLIELRYHRAFVAKESGVEDIFYRS